jgi:hypothetical protein
MRRIASCYVKLVLINSQFGSLQRPEGFDSFITVARFRQEITSPKDAGLKPGSMNINHHNSEYIMNIGKIITSASLAFAILGGAFVLAPSSAHAAQAMHGGNATKVEKSESRKHIYCPTQVGHRCGEKPDRPRYDRFHDPKCKLRACAN